MPIPAFAPRLAFVDVETTGSSPGRERVTEIGVVRVDFDGDAVRTDEWATLVNPGIPIPAEIQWSRNPAPPPLSSISLES